MGEQIKQAFTKVKEYWVNLSPKLKKIVMFSAGGLLALAIGITLFLNLSGGNYAVLFPQMEKAESLVVYNMLQDLGIEAQIDATNQVTVKREDRDYAIGQLAMKNYPKSELTYEIFNGSTGLTTTDFEKRQILVQQAQNRLQEIINRFDGVENNAVTLNLAQETNRVWEEKSQKSTGNVAITLKPGVSLSRDQVSGIKYLVATGVGIDVKDITVVDTATWISMKGREDSLEGVDVNLEMLGFEQQIEQSIVEKAMNVLSLAYKPDEVRVSATVVVDYDKMVSESKKVMPSDESKNNSGVLSHEEESYTMNGNDLAGGIAGEEQNTDETPVYVDENGDGKADYIDYTKSKDYVTSYIMEQVERDKAQLKDATIAITLKNKITDATKQSMVDNISKATNIAPENVSIESFNLGEIETTIPTDGNGFEITPALLIPIGAILLLLMITLITALMLRKRAKKRKLAVVATQEQADNNRQEQMRKEIEDRKRQLKETAENVNKGDAITNEVREFAKANPEITANLLRQWLKEDAD